MASRTVNPRNGPGRAGAPSSAERSRTRLLPPAVAAFLTRRIAEMGGLGLVLMGFILIGALVTYHPGDPSWNTAGATRAVRNLMGVTGAHVADLLLQTLGAAAYLLGLIVVAWGWRVATHRSVARVPSRIVLGLAGVLLCAIALAAVPANANWPIGTHLGGSAGAILLAGLARLVGGSGIVAPVAGALAAGSVIGALGIPAGEWWRGMRETGTAIGAAGRTARDAAGTVSRTGAVAAAAVGRTGMVAAAVMGRSGAAAARSAAKRTGEMLRREPRFDDGPNENLDGSPDAVRNGLSFETALEAPSRADGRGRSPVRSPPRAEPDVEPDFEPDFEDAFENGGRGADGVEDFELPAPRFAGTRSADPRPRAVPIVQTAAHPAQPSRPSPPKPATLDLTPGTDYELPPLDLLQLPEPAGRPATLNEEGLRRNAQLLEGVLADFGVRGEIQKVHPGPVVTLYELEPAPGTKSSRVIGLADDIARSMSAVSVRVAVVPGRNVIGIELPNTRRETVYLRELLAADAYERTAGKLALVLGKDIGGGPIIADLARFPHLLVAGTTGSGKSVAINTMILSLLYRLPPDRCRFIMIDPKMLELSVYEGIPHLLTPVVTDPKKAVVALKWTVREMEDRYRAMSKLGVRNIEGYNARLREARQNGESLTRRVQTGFDPDTGKPIFEDQPLELVELPYIVVVVDEMADLMLVAGKDIEAAIQRLAQMARAAGIHLIMATQRPSVDVITGTIKANFPTRISFQVTSKIDSRTILGEQGAEQLLGQGDMLYMAGGGRITRVHGPFVRDDEVEAVVKFLKAQGEPNYVDAITEEEDEEAAFDEDGGGRGGTGDELYDKAVAVVCRERKASTSFIQRHLRIGYNSAARLIERMEQEGVVSKANHAGKREVLARNIDDPER